MCWWRVAAEVQHLPERMRAFPKAWWRDDEGDEGDERGIRRRVGSWTPARRVALACTTADFSNSQI